MRQQLKAMLVVAITAAIAIKLFSFGLNYPLEFRIRGDAYQYLAVAEQFDNFASIWAYAGQRSVGMPFLEFLVKRALVTFTSANTIRAWVDAICALLLFLHLSTAWLFARWTKNIGLIHSENGNLLLFAFLGTYPALIGHTTAPLTDTLAIDLVLCATMALDASLKEKRTSSSLVLSYLSAILFGFLILVRPASLLGVGAALAVGGLISLIGQRNRSWRIAIAALGCAILVTPFVSNCTQTYGHVCLQTMVPDFSKDAQSGLAGGRTLWSRGYTETGIIRTLPDQTMATNYASRCNLTSFVGITENSLTGCLLSRPLAVPAYIGKKWVGLFDHFRFTPFLEEQTPGWLRWLSRAYDSLSWIGFALLLFSILRMATPQGRSQIKSIIVENIAPAILICYSLLLLGQHTFIHIEERYGFPIIPLCATALIMYIEQGIQQYRSFNWRNHGPLILYCSIAWATFITQIIIWDNTV